MLFLATRERNFLFYVIYLGAFLLVHLGFVSGLGFQNLWPERPGWNNQFDLLLPTLLHLPATLLVTQFLETRHRAPGWHQLLWGMTVLMLAIPLILYGLAFGQGGFSSPAVIGAIRVFILLNGLLLLLYLLAAWRVWRQGFGAAGYFTLAWSCLILGVLVHHLHRLPGLLPSGFLIDNSLTLGSTLEYLLLALALGDRFNQLKEARREAERREHALQRAYATDLERQVEERTQALREAMTQTQTALEGERLAREEQREFLLTLSHDLRTPLAVIDNIAQNLALEAAEDDCQNRTRFDRILEASARMIRLLDDYLDEKRFSLLREGPRRLPCDWGRLLEEAAAAARLLSDQHRFQVEVGGCPAGVLCDPELTALALRTLADNAVKYTPAGTRVTLSARRAGRWRLAGGGGHRTRPDAGGAGAPLRSPFPRRRVPGPTRQGPGPAAGAPRDSIPGGHPDRPVQARPGLPLSHLAAGPPVGGKRRRVATPREPVNHAISA